MMHQPFDPPPDVRSRRPDVPDHVAGVIRRALSTSPQARFESAGAMADALRRSD